MAMTCIASSVQHGSVSGGKIGRQSEFNFHALARASSESSAGNVGIGFAIPSKVVKQVVEQAERAKLPQ